MNTDNYRDWLNQKFELTKWMIDEKGDIAQPEVQIILCCAFSGLAANLWPGKRIDKKRFIQLLINFAPTTIKLNQISTPTLYHQLSETENVKAADVIYSKYLNVDPNELLFSHKVDQLEAVITELIPTIAINEIREASLAAIIYRDLRCALIHEYTYSENIYSNVLDISFPYYFKFTNKPKYYILVLPFPNFIKTFEEIASNLFTFWNTASDLSIPQPDRWCIDG